ncbi:MAG TPA: DUF4124 domain-containing protein [Gammaproteobacteria bacterium]|jgi:hypothetical protein|nr:DUF4124 domain-containing protein [Gammaproteobacteria bacterium]
MYKRIIFLLITSLLAGSVLADSPIYKWVDKDGQVHYSTVPHSSDAKPIDITNSAQGLAPAAGTVAGSAAADKLMPQIAATDSAACKAAKQKLGQYMSADVLYTTTPDGKQKKLSQDEQAKVVQRARNDVTVACTPQEPPA